MKVNELLEKLMNVFDKSKPVEVVLTQYTEDFSDGSIEKIVETDKNVLIYLKENE